LRGAAQAAEQRIFAVGGPSGKRDAVDTERGNSEKREDADVEVGDAEINVVPFEVNGFGPKGITAMEVSASAKASSGAR